MKPWRLAFHIMKRGSCQRRSWAYRSLRLVTDFTTSQTWFDFNNVKMILILSPNTNPEEPWIEITWKSEMTFHQQHNIEREQGAKYGWTWLGPRQLGQRSLMSYRWPCKDIFSNSAKYLHCNPRTHLSKCRSGSNTPLSFLGPSISWKGWLDPEWKALCKYSEISKIITRNSIERAKHHETQLDA